MVKPGTPVAGIVHLYYASLGPMVNLHGQEEKGLTREFIVTHLRNEVIFPISTSRVRHGAGQKLPKIGSSGSVTKRGYFLT